MRIHISLAICLLLMGCAAEIGPVKFAIGDAYVKDGEVHGGTLSSVTGSLFGAIVNAGASVFGGTNPPTIIVNPNVPANQTPQE